MKSTDFKNSIKEYHSIFVDAVTELDDKLQKQMKKIKQEYNDMLVNEKIRMLMEICEGEKLNFDIMKTKYLKNKEINQIVVDYTPKETETTEEELLDILEYNGKEYYYKTSGDKTVYDMDSKVVGVYKDNKIIFN
jgi:predicted methyltransferase